MESKCFATGTFDFPYYSVSVRFARRIIDDDGISFGGQRLCDPCADALGCPSYNCNLLFRSHESSFSISDLIFSETFSAGVRTPWPLRSSIDKLKDHPRARS